MKWNWSKIICSAEITFLFLLYIQIFYKKSSPIIQEVFSTSLYSELSAPSRDIQEFTTTQKTCYLTFDDGPSENTEKILDILSRYHAKATFFVVGQNLEEDYTEVMDRIVQEGHAIGLHANVHVYEKLYASKNSFLSDYECLYKKLKEQYGIETALFRFPGGSACTYLNGNGKEYIQIMHERGFYCFDWNVSGEDSVGSPEVASIQEHVFKDVFRYEEPIVLLHDSSVASKTVDALPQILEKISAQGYVFESLEHVEEYIFPANR